MVRGIQCKSPNKYHSFMSFVARNSKTSFPSNSKKKEKGFVESGDWAYIYNNKRVLKKLKDSANVEIYFNW